MEFNISDLLDVLPEADVDIRSHTTASESRIKELTMKKIHTSTTSHPRGRGFVSKLLIAAALITALAIPVLAATGHLFTDWLEGLDNGKAGYDDNLAIGSEAEHWQLAGWVVNLAAREVSAEGLTLVCTEIGAAEKTGSLAAGGSFWLEQWNGAAYTAMTPQAEVPAGEERTIPGLGTLSWSVGWADSYGTLASGSYRLGLRFTYTDPNGKAQTQTFYAKFRVFNEEMGPYIDQCKDAFDTLRQQERYHLTYTMHMLGGEYSHTTYSLWKNGSDYLLYGEWFDWNGSIFRHEGYLLRDGVGYSLNWEENDPTSTIDHWQFADYVCEDTFDLWYIFLSVSDAHVGELYAEGNRISIVSSSYFPDTSQRHWELAYTFDAQGRIAGARKAELPELYCEEAEKIPSWELEVLDSSADEIARIIDGQAVGIPYTFSWSADQAAHPAGAEGVRTTGFVNTTARTIESAYDALTAAKAEYSLTYYSNCTVSFDEAAAMWKVAFAWTQNNSYWTVYLDTSGITRLIVTE